MLKKRESTDLGEKWRLWLSTNKNSKLALGISIECILVQNTNWGNVEATKRKIEEFRTKNLDQLDFYDIRWWEEIEIETLKELIRPSGFHNQKSVYIKELIMRWPQIVKTPNLETRRKLLKSVKGIGNESADSILVYVFDEASFIIDNYTKRILTRAENMEAKTLTGNYMIWKNWLEKNVPESKSLIDDYKWLHAYFIHIGRNYCLKTKPKCNNCEINRTCDFYLSTVVRE